ncbi:hypothetical protein GGF46_004450 [Coemansia sp. RSA 552]|nr:hypothetical protein GGF46_004450 [Coemansia sp. RSA 552]
MGNPRIRLVNRELEQRDSDAQTTPSRTKRPRRSVVGGAESGDDAGSAQVKEECLRLYTAVKEMEKNGEPVCIAFNKLPSKKEYPDYYVEIKKPVALDIIKNRITRGLYGTVADFVADIDLMCDNAQTYNIPDSYIHEIAGDIRKKVHELAAPSLPVSAPVGRTPQLKLRIRESASSQSDSQSRDDSASSQVTPGRHKRKHAQYYESESDSAAAPEQKSVLDVAKGKPLTDSQAEDALDELFQAIYDADLGKAVKLLDIPNLPINDFRQVYLKDPEMGDTEGGEYMWAPLHAAACYGRLKVAQLLCRRGAIIEPVDTLHKSTPLAWAAYTGRKRLAKFLVREFNADVNARNAHDQIPIQIAVDPGHPMWSEFLLPTDGTHVDLPPPEVQDTQPEKKTPAKKVKTRSQDAPTPSSTPGGSMSAAVPGSLQALTQSLPPSSGAQLPTLGSNPSQPGAPASIPENGPPIPQCIGGIGHKEVTHPQMAEAMTEIVARLEEAKDSDGEALAEPFEELPDREEYPEYYEVIPHPMALELVKRRIAEPYRSFDAFNYDMVWIFNNAMFFNEPESEIYNAAATFEKEYKRICREVVQKYQIPFDTSYNDAETDEGRYVSRIAIGEHDLFVGDFAYVRTNNTQRIAMVTRLRVGGPSDRRKYIDGRWMLTPSEVPEAAGQPVFPHQLFVGPAFEGLGVRGVLGKCFVLLPNVYARVYPQGYAPQDLYICESMYIPAESEGQKGTFKPLSNWAHDFKTPLMKPPAFIQYCSPLNPQKLPVAQWNNGSLLPTVAHTVMNRKEAAEMLMQKLVQAQAQAQAMSQLPVPPQPPAQAQTSTPASTRLPGTPQQFMSPAIQNRFNHAYQTLMSHYQQNVGKVQAQQQQRDGGIRKQALNQVMAMQQQNPGFMGSPHHQALLKQEQHLLNQSQQTCLAQQQQLQQNFTQQIQALSQTFQQQQQQQATASLSAAQLPGMVPLSPGMVQASVASPTMRPMMSSMQTMPIGSNGALAAMSQGIASTPHAGMARAGSNLSPMPMLPMADGGFGGGLGRASTPTRAPSGTAVSYPGMSSPLHPSTNAHAMMAMLLQQKQQQQQQQQQQLPSTPKQTHMPLSPDLATPNGQATPVQAQSQQMLDAWKKATRVFLTHGNARIERELAIQIATPNASMFMHIPLNDRDANHALHVPASAGCVLIRPVPGPLSSSGKVILSLSANARQCFPRVIPDDGASQHHENGASDDMPSNASDDAGKDDSDSHTAALARSSNYAFEVQLQAGMTRVEIEAISAEWQPEAAGASDNSDQQVPPGTPAAPASGQRQATKHYLLVLTCQ